MATQHRRAGIIAVGDELALGQKLDTNSQWLAERLLGLGYLTSEHVTVSDDAASLSAAVCRLARAVDVVLITGGLGPTADDLTRQAVADAMNDQLVEDDGALDEIRGYFAESGRAMPEGNRVQALRPSSARCIRNEFGTAPGLAGELGDARVFCLPGPPREMRPMFERAVAPALPLDADRTIVTRMLNVFGLGESEVATRLGTLMDRDASPLVGTTASAGVVTCRIRYEGPGEGAGAVDEVHRRIASLVEPFGFSEGGVSLAEAALRLLRERRWSLASAESCTGGTIGELLTAVPGSSDAYVGGWVTYSNAMKSSQLGVPINVLEDHGAVSGECAAAMAEGALRTSGADTALAVTGVAGPGGGSPGKPVGTVWIACAGPWTTDVRRFLFAGERENVRRWSAMSALAMLRLALIGRADAQLLRQQAVPVE